MDDQPITHKSEFVNVPVLHGMMEKTNKNGVKCEWSGNVFFNLPQNSNDLRFSWIFDWSDLKKTGVDGLSGHITVTAQNGNFYPRKIDVNITDNHRKIETSIESAPFEKFMYEYHLLPYFNQEEVSYDELFLASELNDTVLVIDDKRLHVNRAFLSIHSEFFRVLFSSKFKEGQMDEIPIEDVSYADFGLLMSTIYPETVYPNGNKTVKKLLELADRFLIPSVIRHVEFHLLHDTQINSEKLIWMGDEYGMTKLLKKCINEMNTIEKVKKLHTSPEYEKLSKDTKAAILDRLMKTF